MKTTHMPQILLIGGCAGSGKSTLAKSLAQEFGVSVIQTDDIRMAIQATILPEHNPGLHAFSIADKAAEASANLIFKNLMAVAHALEPAILAIMSHHIAVPAAGLIIIEGDGILPRLGSANYLADRNFPHKVNVENIKAAILIEENEEVLHKNMAGRGRAFSHKAIEAQRAQVEGSLLYGEYLQKQATKHKIATIVSRPYKDLNYRFISEVLD